MKSKKSIRDIMYEYILAEHNEEVRQGDLLKEIQESRVHQLEFSENAYIYGRNYYTLQRLQQIQTDASKYLFEDINADDIKSKIDNNSNSNSELFEFLYQLEDRIRECKEKIDNDCDPSTIKVKHAQSTLSNLVDWLNGGSNNEN